MASIYEIKLWQDKLDEALAFCYKMETLLRQVTENPDDYIKHHAKAAQWLSEVREVISVPIGSKEGEK